MSKCALCSDLMVESLRWTPMTALLNEEANRPEDLNFYLVRDKTGRVMECQWQEGEFVELRGLNGARWLNEDMIDCYCPYPKGPTP